MILPDKDTDKLVSDKASEVARSLSLCGCGCGRPKPYFLDLTVIDACTRKCGFCPRGAGKTHPDKPRNRISLSDAMLLRRHLDEIEFEGVVSLAAMGEPLMHPRIREVAGLLGPHRLELVTNGDLLSLDLLKALSRTTLRRLFVSVYDERLLPYFQLMVERSGVPDEFVVLRERWNRTKADAYLTNRGGAISGKNPKSDKPCHYPSYSLGIDWDLTVYMCCQDWTRKYSLGSLRERTLHDIWHGARLKSRRRELTVGRVSKPCADCDVGGGAIGREYAEAWRS
jgi:radical SAM protein with 4Fe4S-binding SPASM domain